MLMSQVNHGVEHGFICKFIFSRWLIHILLTYDYVFVYTGFIVNEIMIMVGSGNKVI